MKNLIVRLFALTLFFSLAFTQTFSQEASSKEEPVLMRVKTNDGTEFIGYILKDDKREVLMKTEEQGELYIPKYSIQKIEEVLGSEFIDGKYVGEERFSTRYFISTNGMPIKKGDHYAMFNMYGPEAHFAVADNFSVGVMSTWVAMPVIGTAKYSFPIAKNVNASVGLLAGSTLWAGAGYGALGYGALTFGNRTANFTLSGGYAGVSDGDGSSGSAPLFSAAGMVKIGKRVTFVGDSFIYAGQSGEGGNDTFALIMPGLRFNGKRGGAFQIGVGGLIAQGEVMPVPVPMFGWFKAIN